MHPFSLFGNTNVTLVFHEIASRDWFKNALLTIKKFYRFISIEEVHQYFHSDKNFNNCCHITFDDGDQTFYTNALPVLQELNIPATIFISPKMIQENKNYWFQDIDHIEKEIGREKIKETIGTIKNYDNHEIDQYHHISLLKGLEINEILDIIQNIKEKNNITIDQKYNITMEQLLEIDSSDLITIGAHTINHPILKNEKDQNAAQEISDSITQLSQLLNKKIDYFAYPNGIPTLDYSPREIKILKDNDIKLAFSSANSCFNKKSNPHCIPRSGFGGLNRETKHFILGKLLLMPSVWQTISKMNDTISNERKKLLKTTCMAN